MSLLDKIIRRTCLSEHTPFALIGLGSTSIFDVPLRASLALRRASTLLSIPTHGVESLNAALVCSIPLFEATRPRRL